MTTINIPHKFEPREYQLPLLQALDSGIKRAVIVWHRRSGKDKTCWNYMIKKACEKVGTYFYFLPTYSQAKKVIWDNIDNSGFKMLDHIPKELADDKNKTELKIELANGSVIQLIAADQFEKSGVGTNPVGVVFSEYSISSPEVWDYVRPILTANGGWAIFNFTPRGKNHAWNILKIAEEQETWFAQILTVDDTGIITKEQIEQEKVEGMPVDLVDQEYYCKFIDDASSYFKRVDANCIEKPKKFEASHKYQMGVDLAKLQDYTVISVIDLSTFKQVELERFNQMDYTLIKARIEAVWLRYGKPLVYLDSTGVGEPVYDDLVHKGIDVEPYKFNERTREDLLKNLQIILEQDRVQMLDNTILIDELKSFRYELSERGKLKIKVPDGLHDDTVFATALSVWDIPTMPIKPLNQNSLRHLHFGGINTTDYSEPTSFE